jgi:hypothetical protein
MKTKYSLLAATLVLAALVLSACGGAAPAMQPLQAIEAAPTEAPAPTEAAAEAPAPAATAAVVQTGQNTTASNLGGSDHMIVKNGDIKLLVKDTATALDGVTQIVSDTQGYVVSSRVWYQSSYGKQYEYATVTIGVPVDQFDSAVLRLGHLAEQVTDLTETGQDVTDQYVDLQSQLTNLEATRDRIKTFLTQAQTVDDALKINQQLSDVEAQIEQIQGKMNYLSGKSAYSTISVELDPDLPPVIPTATPTATPMPIEALGPWDPGRTTQAASQTLVSAYRVIVDVLIWIFVVVVPIVAPPLLLIWLVVWLRRRSRKPAAKP